MATRQPEARPKAAQLPGDLIELGVLRGAYGVKGWLRVQPHAAEATVLRACRRWWLLGEQPSQVDVTAARRHGSAIVAKLQGCDTPEQAERLRGVPVGASRAEFPPAGEGEIYWVDLIGARVVNRSGVELGAVSDVISSGAQELLEVRQGDRVRLVPMVGRHVDEVDLAARTVRVDWEANW